jgi:HNH endonuclease/NUMOD3 motif
MRHSNYIDPEGYVLVYVPDHPFCKSTGYVLQHRLVMERHLGYLLMPCQVVHHKNRIKADNRICNLEVMCWPKHAELHSCSPEHRAHISKVMKQVMNTPEMIESQRLKNLGPNNPAFGKTPSKESCEKRSVAMSGSNNPNYGKKFPYKPRRPKTEAEKEHLRQIWRDKKS